MQALNVGGNSSDAAPPSIFRAPDDYLFNCRDCKHNGGKDRACIGDKRAIMCAEPTDMATDNHAPSVR
jgi:hypothetical protein